jgi:hypothetical protein
MPRLYDRYGSITTHQCSTQGCTRTAKSISRRCWVCDNNQRRFAHPLQQPPHDGELAPFVRRAETQRASHKAPNIAALEAHFHAVVSRCRGQASPSYRENGRLTFNVHDREASAAVRDISEGGGMTFIRCLDLLTALHLMEIERPHAFRSEDAFKAVVVEVFRKAANVGLKFAPLRPGATRQQGYRRAMTLPTRMATAGYLNMALGGAASALAKLEAKRADSERSTRADYWQTIRALEETN